MFDEGSRRKNLRNEGSEVGVEVGDSQVNTVGALVPVGHDITINDTVEIVENHRTTGYIVTVDELLEVTDTMDDLFLCSNGRASR